MNDTTTAIAPTTTDAGAYGAVLAQLPAQLLHIAALFASDDPAKGALCNVHVAAIHGDGDIPAHIRVASTNGHYAFRCRLPIGDGGHNDPAALYWLAAAELQISAGAFRKRSAYAQQALIRSDGEARLYGAKRGEALGLLEARPIGDPCSPYSHKFPPGFDGLWPDPETMPCTPSAPICWNGAYMADIGAIAKRFSATGTMSFRSGASPTTPLYLSCDAAEAGMPAKGCALEWLLMPVLVRR